MMQSTQKKSYQSTVSSAHLSVGVGTGDITPPAGCANRCWGAAQHDIAAGIHRPLIATAWFIAGDEEVLLVGMDGAWWQSNTFERRCRQAMADAVGIRPDQVLLCLSHSHAAVPLTDDIPDGPGADLLRGYVSQLPQQLADIAQAARSDVDVSHMQCVYGCSDLASQRDELRDGRWIVGSDPCTDADQTLVVGRIVNAAGDLKSVLVNYACHPTTLAWKNELISPDFIGALREQLEQAYKVPVLFLQGASGDLAPRLQYAADPAVADQNGRQLAFAVQATLAGMPKIGHKRVATEHVVSGADLGCWEEVPMSERDLQDAEFSAVANHHAHLDWRSDFPTKKSLEEGLQTAEGALAERLRRRLRLRQSLELNGQVDCVISTARIGQVLFCGTPAEPFSAFQDLLRSENSDAVVLVVNHCNGGSGYLMPRACYQRHEFYAATQTPFAAGSFESIQQQALAQLETINSTKELVCPQA